MLIPLEMRIFAIGELSFLIAEISGFVPLLTFAPFEMRYSTASGLSCLQT